MRILERMLGVRRGPSDRFWEIDLLRGVALVLMMVFHIAFDIYYFGDGDFSVSDGIWPLIGRSSAFLFILLVGVSLSLARSRSSVRGDPFKGFATGAATRGAFIFCLGMVITAVTWSLMETGSVVFGILHLIGLSIVIAIPFTRFGRWNVTVGMVLVAAGLHLRTLGGGPYWLLWTGWVPDGFVTVDYYPFLPWFGVVLIGIFIGDIAFGGHERLIEVPDLGGNVSVRPLTFLGRNSLPIYLVHQPIILTALHLTGTIDVWSKLTF